MDSYAFTMNDSSRSLSPDMVSLLNHSLSKLGIAILKELYQSPKMQQKNLAASIHTSPTSLSNILNKLENIQPQLLIAERVGRSKYYSLTETASLYVAQVILPQSNKIHRFSTLSREDTLISETLDILCQFQETAGQDWDIMLDNILVHDLEADSGISTENTGKNELFTLYADFMNHMKQMEISNQTATIHEIHNILGQPVLIKRLNAYLARELANYHALEPLFKLEKQDFEKASRLIDEIFTEIAPNVFPKASEAKYTNNSHINKAVSDEQYGTIFRKISNMKNELFAYEGDKDLALKHWQTIYPPQSPSIVYIAEKCSYIYLYNKLYYQTHS